MPIIFDKLSIWHAQRTDSRRIHQVGMALAGLAIAWMLFMSAWGLDGPFPAGHFAAHANIGVGGWNCLRFKTLYPIWRNTVGAPTPADYYLNHPGGVFWDAAAIFAIFGRHNWALRLLAVTWSTLTPFFLYRIGRAVWGPIEGGLCAVAFVVLPITLGFSNFHALEAPTIFGCTMALWGYLRLVQTSKWRYWIGSVVGFAFAVQQDWPALMWGAALLTIVFLRAFVVPASWIGSGNLRRLGFYWATMVAVALAAVALHIGLVYAVDRLATLVDAHASRSVGNDLPLSTVLETRKVRIELMFTGLAIWIGKIAVPVILLRTLVLRREFEFHPIPLLLVAAFQYVHFKGGADVHIFWPQYFAPYFALAVGALSATVHDLVRAVVGLMRSSERLRVWVPAAACLAAGIPPLLLVGKDGAFIHRLGRLTAGRFVEERMDNTVDRDVALRWFSLRFPPGVKAGFHSSWRALWNEEWELGTSPIVRDEPASAPGSTDFFGLDARFASAAEMRAVASRFHVNVVGPFFLVDKGEPRADIDGYSFNERRPKGLEWFTQGNWEPVRRVTRNPWVTWEWRRALGQEAATPTQPPTTFEEIRIAHNIAVSENDTARAEKLRGQLKGMLSHPIQAEWANRTQLLGWRDMTGRPGMQLLFVAGHFDRSALFDVLATVIAPPRWSTLPHDPTSFRLPWPPPMPIVLWTEGFIYSVPVPIPHRPGTERFVGYFDESGVKMPIKNSQTPWVELLTN
jgi:hypothetical protein